MLSHEISSEEVSRAVARAIPRRERGLANERPKPRDGP